MDSIRHLLSLVCCTVAVTACAATTETTASDDDAVTTAPACSTDTWGESRRAEIEAAAVAKAKSLIDSQFKPLALSGIKIAYRNSGMTLRDEDVSFADGPNAIRTDVLWPGTDRSTLSVYVRFPSVVVASPDGRTRVFVTKRHPTIDADIAYAFKLGTRATPNFNSIGNLVSYSCNYSGISNPGEDFQSYEFFNQATIASSSEEVMRFSLSGGRMRVNVTLTPVH